MRQRRSVALGIGVLASRHRHRHRRVPVHGREAQRRRAEGHVGRARGPRWRHRHVLRRLRGQDNRVGGCPTLEHRHRRRRDRHAAGVVVGDRASDVNRLRGFRHVLGEAELPPLQGDRLVLLVDVVVENGHAERRRGRTRRNCEGGAGAGDKRLVVGPGSGGATHIA